MSAVGEPKISVIVPVYKVELYLRKCLDSIVDDISLRNSKQQSKV